jgi:thiol-disulfide isomerase/thioredoxin
LLALFGLTPAPEIDRPGFLWFNTERPLSLADLLGRLVVLDFWTACCVNCLHTLPTLRRIEETFPDTVAVIGVNSPKYPAECDAESLQHAIARHNITHPVIHDPALELWRAYGVTAWPTLVFVDPQGRILGDLPGEPASDRLVTGLGEMLRAWRGMLPRTLPRLPLRVPPAVGGRLRFPSTIKALSGPDNTKRWACADAGHHQVVLFDDAGRELQRIGCGRPGMVDLDAATSAFSQPQGIVAGPGCLFVADTGNHAIRRIDLVSGRVSTIAGSGIRGGILRKPTPASEVALASVWDVEWADGRLYFANAGTHQIGVVDVVTGTVWPIAGSGHEDLVDGAADRASLAQPTGLAIAPCGHELYFTDSEASAVRVLHMGAHPHVETLVGGGLFDFGHADGPFGQARMQHCRGIAIAGGQIIVADSYNSSLRCLDLRSRVVHELCADRWDWPNGVKLKGGELSGVALDGANRLLAADTNHHRIVEIELTGGRARTWAN